MKKRIIIVGKGGSGKDYLRTKLERKGLKYCVSHTTRPPRDNESEGKDYFFISNEEAYSQFVEKELFYEWVVFNDWIYGTSKKEFDDSNLFIMTPSGIKKMSDSDRKESYVLYLDIPEDIRRERLLTRKDADNVERRLEADRDDFNDFVNFDGVLKNPYFDDIENILELSGLKL